MVYAEHFLKIYFRALLFRIKWLWTEWKWLGHLQHEQLFSLLVFLVFVSQTWDIHAQGKNLSDLIGFQIPLFDKYWPEELKHDALPVEISLQHIDFGFSISKTNFPSFPYQNEYLKIKNSRFMDSKIDVQIMWIFSCQYKVHF